MKRLYWEEVKNEWNRRKQKETDNKDADKKEYRSFLNCVRLAAQKMEKVYSANELVNNLYKVTQFVLGVCVCVFVLFGCL